MAAESPAEAPVVAFSTVELQALGELLSAQLDAAEPAVPAPVLRRLADRLEAAGLRC